MDWKPIVWLNDTWGYQIIGLTMKDAKPSWARYNRKKYPCSLKRGYVKIWMKTESGKEVVDRALTVETAKKRISRLKKNQ